MKTYNIKYKGINSLLEMTIKCDFIYISDGLMTFNNGSEIIYYVSLYNMIYCKLIKGDNGDID